MDQKRKPLAKSIKKTGDVFRPKSLQETSKKNKKITSQSSYAFSDLELLHKDLMVTRKQWVHVYVHVGLTI